ALPGERGSCRETGCCRGGSGELHKRAAIGCSGEACLDEGLQRCCGVHVLSSKKRSGSGGCHRDSHQDDDAHPVVWGGRTLSCPWASGHLTDPGDGGHWRRCRCLIEHDGPALVRGPTWETSDG